jgi:hypothetical protein
MKRLLYLCITLLSLSLGITQAHAQRDARYDRLTIDKRLIFKGVNIDSVKNDTTNSIVRIKNAQKTLLTANAIYDLIKGNMTFQSLFDPTGKAITNKNDTIKIGSNKLVINNIGTNPGLTIDYTQDGSAGITRGTVTLDNQSLQGVGFGYYGKDPGFVRNQVENTITPTEAANVGISYVSSAAGFTSKLTFANVISQWFLTVKGSPYTGDSALFIRTDAAGMVHAVDNLGYISFRGSPFNNTSEYGRFAATTGYFGLGTATPAYRLDVNGKAIFRDSAWSVTPGINDSSIRIATTQWVKQQGYGAGGGGGGGGSGTVSPGSQYRVAYYATAGTAVTEAAAITANRALISDANGVPTHSAVTNTELGYLGGATSSIQTQINAKQASNAHLTAIAGLSASNDDFLQYKTGEWTNRNISQIKTDLGLTGTNSGDQTISLTGDVTGSGTGSFAATIANNSVSLAKMADIATASFFGRNTAGTGDPEVLSISTAKSMLNLTGTNGGDQTITLTGDVTGSGGGSFAATIANDAVSYAKLQNISATNRLLGRITSGAGDAEELTGTQVTTMLDAFTTSLKGLVPSSGGGTTNFLRADGTWAVPTGASGVTGVGTINSIGASANGAGVSGSNLIMQTVSSSNPGLMTAAQKTRLDSNYYIVTPTTGAGAPIAKQKSVDTLILKSLKDSTDIGFKYTDTTIAAYQKLQYGHWILACSDETTAITTGTGKLTFRAPFAVTVTGVRMSLTTVSSSGIPTIDINEAGTTILSTKLTIDASEKTSTTAATAAVISDSSVADDAEITIDFDVAGTGATGVKVIIYWTRALP